MRSKILAAVSTTLLLAGCGGGGKAVKTEPLSGQLTIDSTNAVYLAVHALETVMSVQVNGVVYRGTIPNPPDTLLLANTADLFIGQANALPPVAGVPFNETRTCPGGGTLQMVGVAAGSSGLAAGDSVTFSARACIGAGTAVPSSIEGNVTVAILPSLGAGSSPSSHVRLTNFALGMTTPGGPIFEDGDVTLERTVSSLTQEVLVATGASMETGTSTSGINQSTRLENFRQSIMRSGTSYTATLDGTVSAFQTFSTFGERSYTIATESPIQWTLNGTGPTAGTLKMTGLGFSSVRVVCSPNSLALAVDSDGNGKPETQLVTSFEQSPH